ncbi:YbhB/YbcL family Raf kinase inhibitor-like protein [Colwellia hornerae]|uniref:YbhB/YbcL family Raf kinase inhibitor-like protein n=1 Tax=Colwellia hornerae TaxID=89402 RepID=A0A5C6Q2W9_9GAMM|nr:YbhB/YbcL family Raf kinase inhibitor-like protein [Colwellia hornerae]TWX46994.1 YbhB/YbcL family Raf kinase inhibitor-like protein [Colwellia hornerae]TWX54330.1 YbhB/YbcL family Raf kinase inhibitor-like protein [Colwellia hornerae]TWX63173.1 YbhB/YbcL family Raf kinase inhibitor-like protein [Colwellia hornerae]
MFQLLKLLSVLSLSVSVSVLAGPLSLTSRDIAQGEFMSKIHEFNGYSCSGGDLSPHLKWSDAPKGTKSFAITAYDPDAPSGSGWWHWQIVNIPLTVMEIPTGAGHKNSAPAGSIQIQNDFGSRAFGGACPPKGHGVHHYSFTIHALSVEKLELPANASGALAGYMINLHTIESSTIESLYQRD